MKRVSRIFASQDTALLTSRTGMFELYEVNGVGKNDTPYHGLKVISSGLADKHVVQIRLKTKGWYDFEGDPVEYSYKGVEVAHGMRSVVDTLEDTREYIGVMEEAYEFALEVDEFLDANGWKN